ncbi:hypothetical protein BLNAU_8801 [Blattamonas nauphoetae]|uniref:Uncharacterized protein n=1 Tax=Blattamonas nauphoetae TaxID=2049346 RepID=A0ABQ9XXK9_9EUKA|nr:hypothetical protein BLNAU_8801 [Blattamonas nauphoetae]
MFVCDFETGNWVMFNDASCAIVEESEATSKTYGTLTPQQLAREKKVMCVSPHLSPRMIEKKGGKTDGMAVEGGVEKVDDGKEKENSGKNQHLIRRTCPRHKGGHVAVVSQCSPNSACLLKLSLSDERAREPHRVEEEDVSVGRDEDRSCHQCSLADNNTPPTGDMLTFQNERGDETHESMKQPINLIGEGERHETGFQENMSLEAASEFEDSGVKAKGVPSASERNADDRHGNKERAETETGTDEVQSMWGETCSKG